MLKIIIYCEDLFKFESQKKHIYAAGFTDAEMIFGNSCLKTREELINENLNSWIFFLDHDCIPALNSFQQVKKIMSVNEAAKPVVFAGVYENPADASLLQTAHNKIANTWLEQSYSAGSKDAVLLGGVFLIYASHPVVVPDEKFWGAEDKLLAKHLRSAGYQLRLTRELIAVHETSKSFSHFVKRAVLHGRHDAVYFGEQRNARISYWIQKTDFSDLRLMPLILLHFCIQRGAKAVQKALPKNKQ